MLTANERLDYGRLLRPPQGYRFAAGVATSYSLDLAALTASALALTLDLEPDEDFDGDRLAILDGLDRLQGRLAIFHQAGKVLVPRKFNHLWTLLEPLLHGIVARGHAGAEAFTSFHPKLWLLHFESLSDDGRDQFRLIVLSRNLTFDRSWDLAVALDGERQSKRQEVNAPLYDFLSSLQPHAPGSAAVADLLEQLMFIGWDYPEKIRELRMLPGGGAHIPEPEERFAAPSDFGGGIGDVLVMSPFLDAGEGSLLAQLRSRGKRRWLVSRAETLNRIGEPALEGWDCYSLHPALLDVEERQELPEPKQQELHAKLIVTTSGNTTHWHLGSANCTNAAFGAAGKAPRNSEFMLRLTTSAEAFRPQAVVRAWEQQKPKLFLRHEFARVEVDDERQKWEHRLRQLVYRLTAAAWQLKAEAADDSNFRVELSGAPPLDLHEGVEVLIRPTGVAVAQSILQELQWQSVRLVDLSAFVEFLISTPHPECGSQFVLQIPLQLDAVFDRREAMFREVVNTPEKLLQYVRLLVDADAGPGHWRAGERGIGPAGTVFGLDNVEELFEHLMHCSSREPHRIDRVLEVVDKLARQALPMPEGLATMLEGFRKFRGALQ